MQKINWLVIGIISIVAFLFLFGGGMMNNWGYASSPPPRSVGSG